jgi:hypothetical protein
MQKSSFSAACNAGIRTIGFSYLKAEPANGHKS